MSYIGKQPVPQSLQSRQQFTGDGSTTDFATIGGVELYEDVFLNGVRLSRVDNEYSFDGTTLTITPAPANGDTVSIILRNDHSDLVALPITDSQGNNVLSESGSVVTLTADAAVIEGSSSGDLVRITQTGSGNALVVEDSANPDSTPFVVDAGGKVGIGTSVKYESLRVVGSRQNTSVGYDTVVTFASDDAFASNTGAGISLSGKYNTAGSLTAFSEIAGVKENATDGNYAGAIVLKTRANGTSNITERMRIDSSGNVLVGKTVTTNTTDGIRISSGSIAASASSTSTNLQTGNGAKLTLCNTSATDNNFSNIGGFNSNGLVTSQIDFINVNHASRTGAIAFFTHNGSSMPERMRIDSSGNVNINNLGSGDVYATSGTLYISSDVRLKNDLGVINESGIEIIKQLTPRYYSWKEDENNRKQLGFFAQEVFPILPEAVPRDLKYEQNGVDENGEPILEQVLDENGEPDYQWGFATQPIVAMLVKAIQEQQTIIESQQSQIDALTTRIEALEATP